MRQADSDLTVESVCREHNISEATFYRWLKRFGEMDLAEAIRLKELGMNSGNDVRPL